MIHVIAVITAKPGLRDTILEAFRANAPTVLLEDGCIEYGAAIDTAEAPKFQTPYGPDTFLVIEKWRDMAALMAHAATPHMVAYSTKTREHVAERRIHILSPV